MASGVSGVRRYRLYKPSAMRSGERLPLVVMLHGCAQDAQALAASTKMNRMAEVSRFMVLYPEKDRLSNLKNCWNWYDTRTGRAQREADSIPYSDPKGLDASRMAWTFMQKQFANSAR